MYLNNFGLRTGGFCQNFDHTIRYDIVNQSDEFQNGNIANRKERLWDVFSFISQESLVYFIPHLIIVILFSLFSHMFLLQDTNEATHTHTHNTPTHTDTDTHTHTTHTHTPHTHTQTNSRHVDNTFTCVELRDAPREGAGGMSVNQVFGELMFYRVVVLGGGTNK